MNMIMSISFKIVVLLLLWFLYAAVSNLGLCYGNYPEVVCNEEDKQVLVSFKQGLSDPSNRLSSWSVHEDCCRWTGVRCNNVTGRVVELHLRNPYYDTTGQYRPFRLHGNITVLPKLEFLSHLDLSNNFFYGLIPHQLGNLTNLRYIDLGLNFGLYANSLSWVARLHSLEYLDMSTLNLHRATDWLQAVSMLPSLSELDLSDCQLEKIISPLGYVNFTSLEVLSLIQNHFNSEIPNWLFNVTSLVSVGLSGNSFYGHIPCNLVNLRMLKFLQLGGNFLSGNIRDCLGQIKHIEFLSFHGNSLDGSIPESLGNLSSLTTLYLSFNQLNGTVPKSIGFLSNLESLAIDKNSLAGIISEVHFAALSKLKELYLSSNFYVFNTNSNWVPPFQLEWFEMNSCKVGPNIPPWLSTQTCLKLLDISESGISGTVPEWFWMLASGIENLILFGNQISEDISNILLNSSKIELSSNRLHGQLPRVSPNTQMLNLANNSFSGTISPLLCQKMTGKSELEILDLSNNLLSGGLSHCWMLWQSLVHVNLGSNSLSGQISDSMGSLVALKSLQLQKNNLSGDIPLSLRNCTSLGVLNFGENELTGPIPSWIGEMKKILAFRLRSNRFSSDIPEQICSLSHLLILDLANNSLSGVIPKCLNNFSIMVEEDFDFWDPSFESLEYDFYYGFYRETISLVAKGRELEYQKNFRLVRSIDLSSNSLSGLIPTEISNLHALIFLNLSHNHLIERIPEKIGGMTMLESLDLSRNHLSGEIPQTMSNLTFLNYLNLSCNNFSGRIPSSTQLQSFDATSYAGNVELCGAPLSKNCTRDEKSHQGATPVDKDGDEDDMSWFYISMGIGFAGGFWTVCGALFFKRTWRYAYFQFVDNMIGWVYVTIRVKVNWFRRRFKSEN